MDVHFTYLGLNFTWDAKKAADNRTKHGVTFEAACQVFFDTLCTFVDATVDGEERQAIVGLDEAGRILFVVHVTFEEERHIRIISARTAEASERKQYENGE